MHISPDSIIIWEWGAIAINATLLFTWMIMILLGVGSWWVTRKLSTEINVTRWQNLLEVLVLGVRDQIQETCGQNPDPYLPFIGTLFIFIATSDLLEIIPGFHPPTGSLSTTAALSICVFFAVPFFNIRKQGLLTYLKSYIEPSIIMLPFNIMGEISRTMALAVRLFGNIMSGGMISAILLSITPLFFPILMQILGLLTGIIQAYIFAILATVFIASGSHVASEKSNNLTQGEQQL
jgi:F-type H+-transporting ATPase subunit a